MEDTLIDPEFTDTFDGPAVPGKVLAVGAVLALAPIAFFGGRKVIAKIRARRLDYVDVPRDELED